MTDFPQQLAQAILETQRIREESWVTLDDFNGYYRKGMHQSAEEACERLGVDLRVVEIVYILNAAGWNDASDWAQEHKS